MRRGRRKSPKKEREPEEEEEDELTQDELLKRYGSPRNYQKRVFEEAKRENIIAVGPTGCGKTFIGAILSRHIYENISSYCDKEKSDVRMFFIVNKVVLVHQQYRYFKDYFRFHKVEISMNKYWGARPGVDTWRKRNWRHDLDKYQFYFMTAQIFLNIVSSGFIGMDDIDLLIFDECHHCLRNSPYQKIMRDFYYPCLRKQLPIPKIFGMTASLISVGVAEIQVRNEEEETRLFEKKVRRVQNNLDSVVYVLGRNKREAGDTREIDLEPSYEMKKYLAEPRIYSQEYSTEFDLEYCKYLFIMEEFNKVYTENGKEYVCHVINDCMNILYELGVWAVYRYLLQIRVMTRRGDQLQRAFLGIERREMAETIINVIDQLMERLSGNIPSEDEKKSQLSQHQQQQKTKKNDLNNMMTLSQISEIPKPNQMSNKVNTLLQILEKYKRTHPNFCALVFVQERKHAYLLTEIIKAVSVMDIRCACLMGHGTCEPKIGHEIHPTAHQRHHSLKARRSRNERIRIKEPFVFGQSSIQQQRIMTRFGKSIDVVITTSVAEEGIDIQACHCVIRFNMFTDLRGYIQSKGRARQRQSDFVVMYNKVDEKHARLIKNIKESEQNLIKTCLMSRREKDTKKRYAKIRHHVSARSSRNKRRKRRGGKDSLRIEDEEAEEDSYEEESLQVETTGARCSLSDALSKVHQYCSLLPCDKYSSQKPIFHFETILEENEESSSHRNESYGNRRMVYYEVCSITLPPNSTLNYAIKGQPCLDKMYAKKSAALEVIKVLYTQGFLDDHLLPTHEKNVKSVKEEYRKQLKLQAIQRRKQDSSSSSKEEIGENEELEDDEIKESSIERYSYEMMKNEVFRSSSYFHYNWFDEEIKKKKYYCFVYGFIVKNDLGDDDPDFISSFGPRKRKFKEYQRGYNYHHKRGHGRRNRRRRRHHQQNFSSIRKSEKLKNGEYFPFGLISNTELPKNIPPIDVYLENETNSPCTRLQMNCRGQVTMKEAHLELCIRFHHFLNSVVLRKQFTGFKKKNYLIIPIHRTTGTIDWNLMISCIHQGLNNEEKEETEQQKQNDEENEKKKRKKKKKKKKKKDKKVYSTLKDKLKVLKVGDCIFSLYTRQLYIVTRMTNYKPTDEFPFLKRRKRSGRYHHRMKTKMKSKEEEEEDDEKKEKKEETVKLTFKKYFEREYKPYFDQPNREIDESLPLIEVGVPPVPSNILFNRHLYHYSSNKSSTKRILVLSDHCIRIPLPRIHFQCSLKFSGLFWFLENYLLLSDLNESLRIPLDLGHLREAMTASSTSEKYNYERLEFFGDRILKLVASQDLFFRYSDYHEGILHSKRYVMTSNIYLRDRNIEKKIYRFAFTKAFSPKLWCPPGYELMDKNFDKKPGRLPKKLLPDLIESLAACAFLSGGMEYSRFFLIEIGFPFKYNATTEYRPVNISCADELYQKHSMDNLEKIIGYTFRHKTLLVQSMAHQSFRYKDIRCYQRLEFLGDAILDFIVTEYFFSKYPKATAENLHDLRGLAVSNEFFAMICVQEKVHRFLLFDPKNVRIRSAMDKFIIILNDTKRRKGSSKISSEARERRRKQKRRLQQESEDQEETKTSTTNMKNDDESKRDDNHKEILRTEEDRLFEEYFDFDQMATTECPKFLADIFESLVGAIYIDSNFSMERVKLVVMRFLEPYLEIFVTMKRLKKSPMRELTELLQDYNINDFKIYVDKSKSMSHLISSSESAESTEESRKIVCCFECEGKTMGYGEGRTEKSARKRCAENILDLIEKNPEFLEFRSFQSFDERNEIPSPEVSSQQKQEEKKEYVLEMKLEEQKTT